MELQVKWFYKREIRSNNKVQGNFDTSFALIVYVNVGANEHTHLDCQIILRTYLVTKRLVNFVVFGLLKYHPTTGGHLAIYWGASLLFW